MQPQTTADPSAGLLLNFSPVTVDDLEIEADVIPFQDSEHLRSLKRSLFGSHVCLRRRDQILVVPVSGAATRFGGDRRPVKLDDDHGLTGALIREALIRELCGLGRTVVDFEPISFLAKGKGDDLLDPCLPENLRGTIPWLSVRSMYRIDTRTLHPQRGQKILGLTFDVKSSLHIDLSCNELAKVGVPLVGRYVETLEPRHDSRIAARRKLVGRVVSIQGSNLVLDDVRGVETVFPASELFLEVTKDNFDECLRHTLSGPTRAITESLARRIRQLSTGPEKLEKIRAASSYFVRKGLQLTPTIRINLAPFLDQHSARFPSLSECPKPVYIFDATGARTHAVQDRGLDQHGPYDRATFSPQTPKVAIVCERRHKGQVEQVVNKLLQGLPHTKMASGFTPYGKGFLRKYGIDHWDYDFYTVDTDSAEAYSKAIEKAIEDSTDRGFRWNLALIQTKDLHKNRPAHQDPYWISKSILLANGVPSQEFRLETINLPDEQLAFALSNVSLACYAKLGGIPWVLRANPAIAHELIFGLGSAIVGEGRLGSRERVVGITTVFSGDGQYILENRSKAVSMSQYPGEILNSLQKTVQQVETEFNWRPGDTVRLVFHAFKPLREAETDAVKEVMKSLGRYDVEYAFVHIVDDNPFLLFDLGQKETRGRNVPNRGLCLRLGDRETLLCCTGPKELKRSDDGVPSPLLLRLHRLSTFTDMVYLTRQAFALTAHSWRSFLPTPMPITVLYSQWIARQLGSLSKVPTWSPNAMLGRIGRTRWFL